MPKPTCCSVPVCDEPVFGRGWCKAHHQRWLTKGDPGTTPIRKKRPGSTCSVEGCHRAHYARYLCKPHYTRWHSGNDLGGPEFIAHPVPDEVLTYFTLHKRIRAARGSASEFACRCGQPAVHWAYQHNDPDPMVEEEANLLYSNDIYGSYDPMCQSCHIRLDREHAANGWFW